MIDGINNGSSFAISIQGLSLCNQKMKGHAANIAASDTVAGAPMEFIGVMSETINGGCDIDYTRIRHLNQTGAPVESHVATHFSLLAGSTVSRSAVMVRDELTDKFGVTFNGTFAPDKDNIVRNQLGQRLQVFLTNPDGTTINANDKSVENLTTLDLTKIDPIKETTDKAAFFFSLSPDSTTPFKTSISVVDSTGKAHNIETLWTKTEDTPTLTTGKHVWNITFGVPENPDITIGSDYASGAGVKVEFDVDGKLLGFNPTSATESSSSPPALEITWDNGSESSSINLDFSAVKANGSENRLNKASIVNGYSIGEYESMHISNDGFVIARYSNGKDLKYARIPLANFNNVNKLSEVLPGVFQATDESGELRVCFPGENGTGRLKPSTYEGSSINPAEVYLKVIEDQTKHTANSKMLKAGIDTSKELFQTI